MADERDGAERANPDALRRALGAIRDLRTRLEQAERALHEPVAIVGMGCRFPGGASSPAQFWELLRAGRDLVTEVPADRWDIEQYYSADPDVPGRMYSRHGGFLQESLRDFDARFFGISPREAESLDPQQRLLLETSWEALEHAGIAPSSLVGTDAGVFVGISTSDYLQLVQADTDRSAIDPYSGTGGAYCVASGRLSYFLGLHGPNIAVDSACSSSLVSVLMAVQALRTRSCSVALAGGVNALVKPETTIYMCNLRALSTTGRCATFDSSADGYVRGEGAGMIVLKRLADAERDGDIVHAIIRGGAFQHDGRSAGLTVPNGTAQRMVIASALADAGVAPADVDYVEAHGTATQLGDPIELRALGAAYGPGRVRPLGVGSVKTNMGHLEAAAGVAGVIKCTLALEHGTIPRHLHLHEPSPLVDWASMPLEIVTRERAWNDEGRRVAGVSSFGISGTIAHVLLEGAHREPDVRRPDEVLPFQVLPLSALDARARAGMARNLAAMIRQTTPVLADVAATLATGRTHFKERAAIVVMDGDDAARQLELLASGALDQIAAAGRTGAEAPRIAFLFTGQGAQYPGMGRTLDARYAVFRAGIDRCASVLDGKLPVPLRTLLFDETVGATHLNDTVCTQPALFAIEFALSELLASWGVRPRVVLGHSVGEFVAAVVSGALPLEAALSLVAERGRLMQSLPAGGAMGAIGLPEGEVLTLMQRYPALDLAAVNAPSSCVVSGPESDVVALIDEVKSLGADATRLPVSHAFHSRLMDPVLDQFTQAAAGVRAVEPQISVISNRTGDIISAGRLGDPAYWRDHLRGTVRFADGVATLGRLGVDLIIELGPTPALIGQARASLPGAQYRWLPTMRRGRDDIRSLAECVAGLFVAGVELDWTAFHAAQPTRRVPLPTYPWQRERFWKKTIAQPSRATAIATRWSHPLLSGRISGPLPVFESDIGLAGHTYLSDHRIFGLPLFPATGFIELALAGAREAIGDRAMVLSDVTLHAALRVPDADTVTVQIVFSPGQDDTQTFRVYSRAAASATEADTANWQLHVDGTASTARADVPPPLDLDAIRSRCTTTLDVADYYDRIRELNADYGPAFRGITTLQSGPHEALAEVRLPDTLEQSAGQYLMHPALLDACVQLAPAAIGLEEGEEATKTSGVPVSIGKVRIHQPGATAVWCHFSVPAGTVPGQPSVCCTVTVTDATGAIVATLEALTARKISRSALRAMFATESVADSAFQVAWRAKPVDAAADLSPGRWLLLADESGTAQALAETLRAQGHVAELIQQGNEFRATAEGFQIDPASPADAATLLAAVSERALPLRGVVLLWPHKCVPDIPTRAALQTAQSVVLRSALSLVQAADKAGTAIWIVTRGSQAFAGEVPDLTQAPLWGLGAVVAAENPATRCIRIDLDPAADPREVRALVEALLRGDDEPVLAFRDATRFVPRLERAAMSRVESDQLLRLEIPKRGQLENLALIPHARVAPGPDEVEIEVRAAGLNFRDVLNALGAYPGDAGALGNECAGVVTAVGSNVTGLQVGDAVISMPQGGIATHVVSPAALTVLKPENLTFAEAATIPVTFLTAHYALHALGRMQRGDRVLIHAAMGGVGMAAMQLARAAGARIIATAGSAAKRERAAALGAAVTADSRSLNFDDEIRHSMKGEGIDIVLNSLAGEFIPKGLQLLRPGGRFIELGKTDVWDDARVAEQFPALSYHVFFLGELAANEPLRVRAMLEDLLVGFKSGALTPLPLHVFALDAAEDAFRFMAQARHSGKIVITPRVPATIRPNATYLITGGLTGLGLAVARSLAAQGARHLMLLGRRAPADEARTTIAALESEGVRVAVASADVSDPLQLASALAALEDGMPPLRGVIHAAGVLDDAVLSDMDWSRFERVLGPKVAGAWNLHEQTRRAPLDFFVNFSSVAALVGSPGQSNYAAANQFLDTLAHTRRALGLPALSINWGSWSEVGMAAALGALHQRRLAASGMRSITPDDGVRLLQELMRDAVAPQVAVLPLEFNALKGQLPALLSELAVGRDALATRETASANILDRLREADVEARQDLLVAMLGEQVLRVLAADANYQPDWHRTLIELGMDSLMAIELRNRIKTHLDVTVTAGELMEGVTLRDLGASILLRIPHQDMQDDAAQAVSASVPSSVDSADDWESGVL